jgi:hypothetical protein
MKIFGFNISKENKKVEQSEQAPKNAAFTNNELYTQHVQLGSPLGKIPQGDLTKPFIQSTYYQGENYIPFGLDNLYPQLMDQMVLQSPLHFSCVSYKQNAIIGGGYNLIPIKEDGKNKVEILKFEQKNELEALIEDITNDLIVHRRIHLFVYKNDEGTPVKFERILPSKVRYNKECNKYSVSEDWYYNGNYKMYPKFEVTGTDKVSILSLIDFSTSPGQDVYPLPFIQLMNAAYLDGQIPLLMKKLIEKTIFGTTVIKRPKEFETSEEYIDFKNSIKNKEGEVASVLLFTADGVDNLPSIEPFPEMKYNKIFEDTIPNIDLKICQAHKIHPVLVLEGSPGIGSGSDIKVAYPIFEKINVVPDRKKLERFINQILIIFNISAEFKINDYKIIEQ